MAKNISTRSIILSGGGTAGSVAPLLALYADLKQTGKDLDFYWIGTNSGPEAGMISSQDIQFKPIPAGKLRRYFSLSNISDIFRIAAGFIVSLLFVSKIRPRLIITAGSFVSVPLVWAAWLFRVPIIVHQQDARPGLANRLMAPFAKAVTVTFESSLKDFGKKSIWTGNPVRTEFKSFTISKREAAQKIGLRGDKQHVVLVMGGGTGAEAINYLVAESIGKLTSVCQVIHVTGRRRGDLPELDRAETENRNYKKFDFLQTDGMIKTYAVADIVVSRCGLSTLTELSYLGKPAILIPMPQSHQLDNARIFTDRKAAIVLEQPGLTPENFADHISALINDKTKQKELSDNISKVMKPDANKRFMRLIEQLLSE